MCTCRNCGADISNPVDRYGPPTLPVCRECLEQSERESEQFARQLKKQLEDASAATYGIAWHMAREKRLLEREQAGWRKDR